MLKDLRTKEGEGIVLNKKNLPNDYYRYAELLDQLKSSNGKDEDACRHVTDILIHRTYLLDEMTDPSLFYIAECLKAFADEGKAWAKELLTEATPVRIESNEEETRATRQPLKREFSTLVGIMENANNGVPLSEEHIAHTYYACKGGDLFDKLAYKWYSQLLVDGNEYAKTRTKYYLGRMYLEGRGVEKDEEKAFSYFEQAAKEGYFSAKYEVAKCYRDGIGVEKNPDKAHAWFEKVFNDLKKHVDYGFASGAHYCTLANFYKEGLGVPQNPALAVENYKVAAEYWHLPAQYELARCYQQGYGVDENPQEAFNWYYRAASKGYVPAQYELARCLQQGYGVDEILKDGVDERPKLAFYWIELAAEHGYPMAMHEMSKYYSEGLVVERDTEKALEWAKKAEEQNFIS